MKVFAEGRGVYRLVKRFLINVYALYVQYYDSLSDTVHEGFHGCLFQYA